MNNRKLFSESSTKWKSSLNANHVNNWTWTSSLHTFACSLINLNRSELISPIWVFILFHLLFNDTESIKARILNRYFVMMSYVLWLNFYDYARWVMQNNCLNRNLQLTISVGKYILLGRWTSGQTVSVNRDWYAHLDWMHIALPQSSWTKTCN